jgi:sRNA-binding carbon storage regulator CsrA
MHERDNSKGNNKDDRGTLVLTLQPGQMIEVGDIHLTFKEYSYSQIRVCVRAPKTTRIKRLGIYQDDDGNSKQPSFE